VAQKIAKKQKIIYLSNHNSEHFGLWQIRIGEMNTILSTEMDVLRRSARKSRMERIKNEYIKEIIGVKGKPDVLETIKKKILKRYGHVKRMTEKRIPKLIMEWTPRERRKR
jgi:hypothetical protein